MDIEKLLAEKADYTQPLTKPVGIALNATDEDRWKKLNERLSKIDKRLGVAMFARPKIRSCMDELEAWADQYERKVQAQSSSVIRGPEAIA